MKSLIPPAEAEARLLPLREAFPPTRCPLALAAGRVLRGEIRTTHDFPPFDRVMMDGIAIRCADFEAGLRRFNLCGSAPAGRPAAVLPEGRGNALEVMTGAPMPEGADCVIPCEWYRPDGDRVVELDPAARPGRGEFIHRCGSDHRKGEVLLRPGTRLGPVEISVAAACGCAEPEVSRHIRIAILGTGDELVPVEVEPGPGQIRQTNVPTLAAALLQAGHPALETGCVPDEPERIRTELAALVGRNDVVILTGGVSKGRRDWVPEIVGELGGRQVLHGVAQRPGKPMAAWDFPGGPVVFGLPGNPVSALVCLLRYVVPALNKWSGVAACAPRVRQLVDGPTPPRGFTLFLPVVEEAGGLRPAPVANSGDLAGLIGSVGFVELEAPFAGTGLVPYFPWIAS